jgi:DNA-binding Lrp family transcriptional regulator
MISGYVLISIKNSYEHEIADKLSLIEEVIEVEPLLIEETALADPFFEDYNLIAKIKANNSNEFKHIINEKINSINGVEKIKIASRSRP